VILPSLSPYSNKVLISGAHRWETDNTYLQDIYCMVKLWIQRNKLSVFFFPRGVTPTSKFVCVLPFPDGDAKNTKIYSGSGKRKLYVQRGGSVCIILHLSACTGVNTSVV